MYIQGTGLMNRWTTKHDIRHEA